MREIAVGFARAIVLVAAALHAPATLAQVNQAQFTANERAAVYSYQIQENTRSERLAVCDDLKVVRWAISNKNDQRWVFHRQPSGKYRIQSLRDGIGESKWLGVGSDGRLVLWTALENNTQYFTVEWNADGSLSLKEPTKGEYVSVSGFTGWAVRWSKHSGDPYTKEQTFKLLDAKKFADLPVTIPADWTQTYDAKRRETVTTIPYGKQVVAAEPVGKLKKGGDFKEKTQLFRPIVVEQSTKQAFNQKSTFVRFNLMPVVVRMKNNVVVSLTDTTDFNNGAYVKKDHWVGYFLDEITISYRNQTGGWSTPEWGPKGANRTGGYNHSTTFGVDASLGFDGKTPQGSVGANWSQSSGTSANLMDIEFIANAKDRYPVFRWFTAQMYDGRTTNVAIDNNWWNAVRKNTGQVDVSRSVLDAPDLSQANFQPVSYSAWQPPNNESVAAAAGQDMRILVEYTVGYREVHTLNLARNDADAFLRGFSLVFGANRDMDSGEAFRSWSTSVIRHRFQIEVVIPKAHLRPEAEN